MEEVFNMIKLKEIHKSIGNGPDQAAVGVLSKDILSRRIAKDTPDGKKVDIYKYRNDIVKYKGYRWLITPFDAADWGGDHSLLMIMPDRDFIIGYISFSPQQIWLTENKKITVGRTKASATHITFRRKGYGKKMYEYLLRKYKVIMSDTELYPGSWKMWTETLPREFPNGVSAGYSDSFQRLDPMSNSITKAQQTKNKLILHYSTNIVFFYNSNILKNNGFTYIPNYKKWKSPTK